MFTAFAVVFVFSITYAANQLFNQQMVALIRAGLPLLQAIDSVLDRMPELLAAYRAGRSRP